MNEVQYVLAFVFMASYALSLGEFLGARGRWIAVATAAASAAGFAALCVRWEQGLMLVVVALAAMGVFVALSWSLWTMANWQQRRLARAVTASVPEPAAAPVAARTRRVLRRLGLRST